MPIQEISRPCPVCQSTDVTFWVHVPAEWLDKRSPVPDKEYTYLRCQECEATFLSEIPPDEELSMYYESGYYHLKQEHRDSPKSLSAILRFHMRLARPIPLEKPGKHLDFGCGPGDYLSFTESYGWESVGVEYSEASARAARARGFQVVLESDLDDLPDGGYDLITMIHSLEHLPQPMEVLRRLVRKLAPSGQLFIEVPYLDCHEFRIFGRWFSMIQAPVHLQFFTDSTVRRIASMVGLELTSYKNNLWTPVHYIWSLLNAIGGTFHWRLSRRSKVWANAIGFPLAVIPAAIASMLGMAGIVRQYYFVNPERKTESDDRSPATLDRGRDVAVHVGPREVELPRSPPVDSGSTLSS